MGALSSSIYNLTINPCQKYDMMFNGAVATRNPTSSPGRYAGMDNGWALSLIEHTSSNGVQQVDYQVSEHRTLPGRSPRRHEFRICRTPQKPLPTINPIKVPKTVRSAARTAYRSR